MSSHAFELSRLASMEPGPRRDKLTVALADALGEERWARPETVEVIGDLLMNLVVAASRDLRMTVAAKISVVDWAPRELALSLALDEFEVAEAVIAHCQTLIEDDLKTIARRGTVQHRRMVAGRPDVTEDVSDALVAAAEPEVLEALLENRQAHLSGGALQACVDVARSQPQLHHPLVARDDLPPQFVEAVYLVVSDHLRTEIAAKYEIDEASLRRVIGAAVKQISSAEPASGDSDAETAALVHALEESGSLSAEFILRSALDGQVSIFEHAVARRSELDVAGVRRAIEEHGAWAAALCCRVCDIPRRDFASLVIALSKAKRLPPASTATIERAAKQTFVGQSPASAADALRRIARAD